MQPNLKILGTGSAFPPQIIDNEQLMPLLRADYPDAWEREDCERTFGVQTRRWAANFETGKILDGCSDRELSAAAAKKAIANAGISPRDIDLIIHTSITPDYFVDPDPAIEILDAIEPGLNAAALTTPVTCVGMTHSMIMANAYIKSQTARTVLLTASNVLSPCGRGIPWQMRFFCGDAAAAAVVQANDDADGSAMLGSSWGSHRGERGTHMDYNTIQYLNAPPLSGKFYQDAVAMQGAPLFGAAVETIKKKHPNVKPDWVLTHQANFVFQRFACRAFELPPERVPYNLRDYGNCLDASCATVLDMQVSGGHIKRGDLVAMIAVGTAWHWSACLLRF